MNHTFDLNSTQIYESTCVCLVFSHLFFQTPKNHSGRLSLQRYVAGAGTIPLRPWCKQLQTWESAASKRDLVWTGQGDIRDIQDFRDSFLNIVNCEGLVYVQLERIESLWLYARILQTCYSATYIYTSIYTYFDFWPFNVFLYTVLLRPCNWSVGTDFWDLMIPTLISDPCSIFAAKVALVDDVNAGVLDEKTVDTNRHYIFKSIEIASEWFSRKEFGENPCKSMMWWNS